METEKEKEKENVTVVIEGRESASEKSAFGGKKQYTLYVIRVTLNSSPPSELAYFRARFSEIEKLREDLHKVDRNLPSCGKGALGGAVLDNERRERKVVEFLEALFSSPVIRESTVTEEFLKHMEALAASGRGGSGSGSGNGSKSEGKSDTEEAKDFPLTPPSVTKSDNEEKSPPPSRPPRPNRSKSGINSEPKMGPSKMDSPTPPQVAPRNPPPPNKRKQSLADISMSLFGSSQSASTPSLGREPSSPSGVKMSSSTDENAKEKRGVMGGVPIFPGLSGGSPFARKNTPRKDENQPPLSPPSNETEEEKLHRFRFRIATELLTTEETYISNLKRIINSFLNPMKAQQGIPPVPSHFSQIEVLLGINEVLYNELQSRLADWTPLTKIGDAMARFAPYLKMYSAYAMRYQAALEEYQKLLSTDSKFAKAHAKCQATIEDHLNFESLVIQPIQRIPRYNLLLRDLLGKTPEDHPDHEALSEALKQIEQVAMTINEHVRQEEQSNSLYNISTSIAGLPDLVAPHRHLIRQGEVTNVRHDKKQLLLLLNDKMVIANKPRFLAKKKYEAEAMWDLQLTWIESLDEKELANAQKASSTILSKGEKDEDVFFRIITPEINYIFGCSDVKERTGWVSDIQKALVDSDKNPLHEEYRQGTHFYRKGVEKYEGKYRKGEREGMGGYLFCDGSQYVGGWEGGKEEGPGMLLLKGKERKEKEGEKEEKEGEGEGQEGGKGEGGEAEKRERGGEGEDDKNRKKGPILERHVFMSLNGEFKKGEMNGYGTVVFATGDVYEGGLKGGEFNGRGKMKWSCGTIFQGEWGAGLMVKGRLTSADGKQSYEGCFEGGKRNGEGVMKYRHGGKYVGWWANDLKEGEGEFVDAEGAVFKGAWVKGRKVNGCMEYVSGDVYTGEWKADMREGKGEMKYAAGKVYSGEWVGGKKQGKGVLTFPDGSEYKGSFDNDYPHGTGVLETWGGIKYEGTWKEGRLEGRGVNITNAEGVTFSGVGKGGRFQGEGLENDCFLPIFPRSFNLEEN